MNTLTSAAIPATAAVTARPISSLSTLAGAAVGFLRFGGGGVAPPDTGGTALGGSGGAAWPATGAAVAVGAAAAGAGILTVGAEVGFGGRVIRTVSFLGVTLIESATLGTASTFGVTGIDPESFFAWTGIPIETLGGFGVPDGGTFEFSSAI